ncbi:MAG: molybdopterin adenylyltransferase [Phycisphaerales bacterium]|nr:molybdopterin adenylyltransferase [Phycisphaerales bacterium]
MARIGILTVSDRASDGTYEDRSGPAVEHWLNEVLATDWTVMRRLVPDEQDRIEQELVSLADVDECCLIITTGGTGPAPRDVTPEATRAACHTMLPGFGERMRTVSFDSVPTAILSRQTAGIRNSCLMLNLPGKPAAIAECLDAVFAAVPYCIDLIGGSRIETNPGRLEAFRPASEKTS